MPSLWIKVAGLWSLCSATFRRAVVYEISVVFENKNIVLVLLRAPATHGRVLLSYSRPTLRSSMADLDERPKFFTDLSRPSQRQVLRDMEEVVRKWRPEMYQSARALLEHLSIDVPTRRSSKRFYHSPYVRALEDAAVDCIPFPPLRPDAKDWGMQFWYNMARLTRLPGRSFEEITGAIRGEVHLRAADVARCLEKFNRGANLPTPPEHFDYDFASTLDGADAHSDVSEESYVTQALDALDSIGTTDDVVSVQSLEILEVRPLSSVDMDGKDSTTASDGD